MNILFIVNHDIVIYNFRKELVADFISRGHTCFIACPKGDKLKDLEKMGAIIKETKMERKSTNPYSDYKLYRTYKKIIKEVDAHFVLTFTIKPNLYGGLASRKLNIPYIVNITGLGDAYFKKGLIKKYIDTLSYKVLKDAKRVFVQNTRDLAFIKSNYHPKSLTLLPGSGVNIKEFKHQPLPKRPLKFVFVSRIKKSKGIETFLEVATHFKNKNSPFEFHVCGFLDEDYEDVLNHAQTQGIITYHGFIKDIRESLKDMHSLIFPTQYNEGLSNVILEAASMGRIVITSNRPGTKEAIKDNETGYLINPLEMSTIIQAIHTLNGLSDQEMDEMSQKASAFMKASFSRERVINAYLNELK